MMEVLKAHKNFLVKVPQEKRTDYLVHTSNNEVAKEETHVIIGMDKIQRSKKMQIRRQVCIQTPAKPVGEQKNQHRMRFTFNRMMDDRCNCGTFSRKTGPTTE